MEQVVSDIICFLLLFSWICSLIYMTESCNWDHQQVWVRWKTATGHLRRDLGKEYWLLVGGRQSQVTLNVSVQDYFLFLTF